VWKSDLRKTAGEIAARADISSASKARLLLMFGKLTLRYTRTRCHSKFEEHVAVSPYKVVARDSSGVVIVGASLIDSEQITHIHFEKHGYWICLGKFREYFRRIGN